MNVLFQPLFYVATVPHGRDKVEIAFERILERNFSIPVNGARLSVPELSPRDYARGSEFLDSTKSHM